LKEGKEEEGELQCYHSKEVAEKLHRKQVSGNHIGLISTNI